MPAIESVKGTLAPAVAEAGPVSVRVVWASPMAANASESSRVRVTGLLYRTVNTAYLLGLVFMRCRSHNGFDALARNCVPVVL